jgi:UDP-glucose 4-epimerase
MSGSAIVVGGAGFIGSHLVEALVADGVDVTVIDSFFLGSHANLAEVDDAVRIVRDDASDPSVMATVLERHPAPVVYNLATKPLLYSFFNPAGAYRVNTDVAATLAELLRSGAYERLVQFSSSEVYGSARYAPMDEGHPLDAHTPYAAGKAGADLLLSSWVRTFDLDVVTVRPFNNYGPRQSAGDFGAIVPVTARRILAGEDPVIEGDGMQTRDFTFVRDTVAAVRALAAEAGARGQTLNVGSGTETTIATIVELVCQALGHDGRIERRPARAADVRRHVADVSRALAVIGPLPFTPLAEGIEETVRWYRDAPT